jgi:hypothetical protein
MQLMTFLLLLQNFRGLWPLPEKDKKLSKEFYQVRQCPRTQTQQLCAAPSMQAIAQG